jgi:hypothetical protein
MQSKFRLSNLRTAGGDGNVGIGALEVQSDWRGFSLTEWINLEAEIAAAAASPDQAPGPELLNALRGLKGLLADGKSSVAVRDVRFDDPSGIQGFSIAEGGFEFSSEGFDQPLARLGLAISHKGLAVAMDDPIIQDFVPRESAIRISLENLPAQELWTNAVNALSSADVTSDEQMSMIGMSLLGFAQQAMVMAQTRLQLPGWHVATTAMKARLDGSIEAAQAALGAVGNVRIEIEGLDKLIEVVKLTTGEDPGAVGGLEMARGLSVRETASDGTTLDRYDIALNEAGQFLINGKEFSLMEALGAMPMSDDGGFPPESGPSYPETGRSGPDEQVQP